MLTLTRHKSNVGGMLDRELEQLRGQVDELRTNNAKLTEAVQIANRQRQEIVEMHPKTAQLLQRVHDLEQKNAELSEVVVATEAKIDLLRDVMNDKVKPSDFAEG